MNRPAAPDEDLSAMYAAVDAMPPMTSESLEELATILDAFREQQRRTAARPSRNGVARPTRNGVARASRGAAT